MSSSSDAEDEWVLSSVSSRDDNSGGEGDRDKDGQAARAHKCKVTAKTQGGTYGRSSYRGEARD